MANRPIIQQAQLTDENGVAAVTVTTGGHVSVGPSGAGYVKTAFVNSANGTITLASSAWGTIFTVAGPGRYEVTLWVYNAPASHYTAFATVVAAGVATGELRIVANNGTGTFIQLSGAAIQVQQSSGVSQTLGYSVVRIG